MKRNEIIGEVSLGNYYTKATKDRAMSGMSAAFAADPEQREKHKARFDRRDRGLNRLKARHEKARKAEQEKQTSDLVARLPELKAEYAAMKEKYKALGGSNWQYADREQNLTDREREARSMEGPMNNLWRQIQHAEKASGGLGEAGELKVQKDDDKSTVLLNPATGVQTQIDKTNPNSPRLTQDETGKLKLDSPQSAQSGGAEQKPNLVGKDVSVETPPMEEQIILKLAGL